MASQPSGTEDKAQEQRSTRRERDVFLLYGAAIRNVPQIDDLADHIARPSPDTTLLALCQLTAMRLGVQRAMISLLDDQRQHILAEATCDTSLLPLPTDNASYSLWLGHVGFPRDWGICERVLPLEDDAVLVIPDLAQDGRPLRLANLRGSPDVRFYAGTALMNPSGLIVGTLCVYDDRPRGGLSPQETDIFKSLAATVVSYLNTYTIRDQYRRGERFTRGLVSFSEGAPELLPIESDLESKQSTPTIETSVEASSATDTEALSTKRITRTRIKDAGQQAIAKPSTPRDHSNRVAATKKRARSARHRSIRSLQDSILPSDTKSMFSRAANVMMTSSSADGVLFLDASVVANGTRQHTRSGTDTRSESNRSKFSSSDDTSSVEIGSKLRSAPYSTSKICQVLGVAGGDGTKSDYGALLEPDLGRLLQQYPDGKVFTFTADGYALSSTETSGGSSGGVPLDASAKGKSDSRFFRSSKAISEMFPDACSVAFIPFWDYERSRWFAGCLCWSNDPQHLLSSSVDLAYFKVFSHSIMRELSRLDALALNQAKTTFVASISHELRSPLHGILGTLQFIKDTPLDSFQTSMLNSMSACGITLLDTINHVMDHAKLDETRKGTSSRRLKNANTIKLSSKPLKRQRVDDTAFNLALATEQVVEAVFMGSSYVLISSKELEAPQSLSDELLDTLPKRKLCFIILDMDFEKDWVFSFPVGSWRRIVMNLFGNAMKYTSSGYIHVALRVDTSSEVPSSMTAITLTITDTGSGMSAAFLANRAFQPFSQENSHAVGTGLGLSIVRQIIDTNGGKIEVSSDPGVGTKLTVKLALTRPEKPQINVPERNQFLSFLPRLKRQKICILHKKVGQSCADQEESRIEQGLLRFTNALVATLEKQLAMDVFQTTEWHGHDADIVICPELSFDYLHAIRSRRLDSARAPVTIFVAMDPLEATTLQSDVRVTNRESVVEIITQPCGPYKLAFILNRCLDRFARPEENIDCTIPLSPIPIRGASPAQQPEYLTSLTSAISLKDAGGNPLTPPSTIRTTSVHGSNTTSSPSTLPSEEEASHILITDDNPLNRKLLVAFMRKQGLQYTEATNGLEALQAYKDASRKFDLILMDMSMPVLDGMSATRAVREYERDNNLPRSSIVALTGLASASAKLEALNSGVDHFMTKPVNFLALGQLLRRDELQRQARPPSGRTAAETHGNATERRPDAGDGVGA
ncbi:hypothetical protein ACN47E_006031 [Coniothyrium glycines]